MYRYFFENLRRVFDLAILRESVWSGRDIVRHSYISSTIEYEHRDKQAVAITVAQYDAVSLYLQSSVSLARRAKRQNKSDYRSTRPRFLPFAFVSIRYQPQRYKLG